MESGLDDPSPRTRAAALAGIARLAESAPLDRLERALADPSPRVVRLAARLLVPHAGSLDADALREHVGRATRPRVRRHLLRLLWALPKWDGGTSILRATRTDREGGRAAIARWIQAFNRRFETPSADQRAAFAAAVEEADVDPATRDTLRHIARS